MAVTAWIVLAAGFHAWPGADVAVAGFFHDSHCTAGAAGCARFPLSEFSPALWFREAMHVLPALIAVPMAGYVAFEYFSGKTIADAMMRARLTLVLAFLAGPGIVANVLTKPLLGRPRPRDTDLFGGPWPFVRVGDYSTSCPSNCSFMSGEAASAFWLIALLILVPAEHRLKAAGWVVPLALAGAAMRVGFGAHYLSDAVLGGLATLVLVCVIAAAMEQAQRLPGRYLKPWRGL